jgi:hypothetical protein
MKRLNDSRRMLWIIFESVEMQRRTTGVPSEIPKEEGIVTDMMYVSIFSTCIVATVLPNDSLLEPG